jgi:cbb3-type cytochrome oxidase maturation protein
MSVILLMIPISLLLSSGFIAAFIWSTKRGQFDHIDLEGYRILNDDNE